MDEKKKVAAVSAVMNYLKTEEEVAIMQAMAAEAAPAPTAGAAMVNAWGISGRQDIMQNNSLMLMKAFHGGRR